MTAIRARLWGVPLLVVSLAAAVGCGLLFARLLPYQTERYRDYAAAEPCPAGAPAKEWEDCLRAVPFTVEDATVDGPRGSRFTAVLSGAPFWNGRLSFGDQGPLVERLRRGDRVTGTVWRGDVVVLGRGDVRQSTSDEPRDDAQMTAAVGTFVGLLAALGLAFGARRLAGLGGRQPSAWRSFGRPLFVTTVIACFAVGFLALWLGLPWWTVPPVAVSAVVGVAWLLLRHRRPSTDPLRPVLDAPEPDLRRK